MPTLWPFCPTERFSEALQWRTDIIRAYSAEQRIRLTEAPRRIYNINHTMKARAYERAKLIAESVGGGQYYLPLWSERQRFSASSGASSISVTTTFSSYRLDEYVCLWQSDEECEVVQVASVSSGAVGLDTPTSRAYSNAFIMPAVIAYCPDGFEVARAAGPVAALSAEWIVPSDSDIGGTTIYPTYRGYPANTSCVSIGAGIASERFGFDLARVDNGFATPFYDSQQSQIGRTLTAAWMPKTLPDLWFTRQFFHHVKGRQGAFWLPDWTKGMTLAAPISPSDTSITIRSVGLDVTGESGDLFIRDAAGTQTRLQYTAVNVSGDNEVLTLSGAAGITLSIAASSVICRMRLVRLAQDRVEIEHQHLGSAGQISRIQVLCDEVPFA